MSLGLIESIARVDKTPELKELLTDAYLCSAITFVLPGTPVEYWDLNYYNPKHGDISHIHLTADSVEVKSTDEPLKPGAPKKLDLDSVRIGIDDALKTANGALEKSNNSAIQKIFISLYFEEYAIWGINFILTNLQIFQARINAGDGTLIDSKLISFMHNQGIAK